MPVIRNIPLELEAGEVLRRQGIGGRAGIRPEIEALLLQLLSGVCDEGLLEPSLAYEIYPVTEIGPEGSSLVPPSLPGVAELAVAVGTIGPRLETRVAELNSRGEPLRGLLLDGIGSAAVDSLTMATCRIIGDEAVSRGYRVSSPVSPGMPGLPITEQRRLLEMVPSSRARSAWASVRPG